MTSHLFVHLPSLLSDSHTGTTALCLLSNPLTAERRSKKRRKSRRRRWRRQPLLVSCNSHIPLSHTQTQFILCTASCQRQDGDGRVSGGVSGSHWTYTPITPNFWDHKHIKIQERKRHKVWTTYRVTRGNLCRIETGRRCHWAKSR